MARFDGESWVGFAPLREAYRDVQITIEFKPELSQDGQLTVDTGTGVRGPTADLKRPRYSRQARSAPDEILDNSVVSDSDDDVLSDNYISNDVQAFDDSVEAGRDQPTVTESQEKSSPDRRLSSVDAVLLVSGENDNLSGDFMAAVIINGKVEFR